MDRRGLVYNHRFLLGFFFLGTLLLVGCGGSGRLSGKVTYKGAEVKGGSLLFTPVASSDKSPGKPAGAKIEDNGTYRVTDPIAVGKNRVSFQPAPMEFDGLNAKPGQGPPKSPYEGLVPKVAEVEIKSGSNTLDIELVAPSGK